MKYYFTSAFLATLIVTTSYADSTDTSPKEPHFIQYNNRINVFSPFYQSYERIKPNAFYAGVGGYFVSELNHSDNRMLLDTEARFGYNYFFNGRDHVTPFAGVGYLQDFEMHRHHTTHKPGIVYGSLGFLYNHEFNTIFNLGLNAKLLLGGAVSHKRFDWGCPVVGADVSLPITFRFGRHRHWDYRIEPFNIYMHGSKSSQDYVGFRNSIGYRF